MSNYEMTNATETINNFQALLSSMNMDEIEAAHKLMADVVNIKTMAELQELARKQAETEGKIETIEGDLDDVKKRQEKTEDKMNNLHQPENKKYKDVIVSKVNRRCYYFLEDVTSENYSLFMHYIFKACYGSIKSKFNLGNWQNLSVKDAEEPGSVYQKVCDHIDTWCPSRNQILEWIYKLISKRDVGRLREERCRSLTTYLGKHNINDKYDPLLP